MSKKVAEEIKELIDSGQVETKGAVILLLAGFSEFMQRQDQMLDRLNEIASAITNQGTNFDDRLDAMEKNIEGRFKSIEDRVDDLEDYKKEHPSLLWLARYRTKQTAIWILIIFIILSIWWVSGFRQPILQYFGIPPF